MSSDPSQELCPSGGGSEIAISNDIPTMDAETSNGDGAQMLEISGEREVTSSNVDINLEPYVGKEFKSELEAKAYYNGYARYMGFSIRKGSLSRSARDRAVTSRIFVCSKEGYRRETSTSFSEKGNAKRQMAITRVGCKAQMWVKKGPSGTWVVKRFQREHNHELTPMKSHLLRSHKNTVDNLKEYIESLKVAGVDISKIQNLFVEEARGIVKAGAAQKDKESEDKKKIQELLAEIQRERRRSAAYKERLLMVLGDMEDHAHHLSKQVEDIVNNMKEELPMDPTLGFSPLSGGSENAVSDSLPAVDVETSTGEGTQTPEHMGDREFTSACVSINLDPYVGKEFKSEQEAGAFYNGYARYMGFSIRKGPLYRSTWNKTVTSRIFVCSKEGFRRETPDVNTKGNVKRRMTVTRVGCKAQLWVKKQASGLWVVKQFQLEHNHELSPMSVQRLRYHKNILDNVKEYAETLKDAGVDTSKIQSLFVEEAHGIGNVGAMEKDMECEDKKKIRELSFELHRERRRSAAYREQLQMLLQEMDDHADHLSKKIQDIVDDMKGVES